MVTDVNNDVAEFDDSTWPTGPSSSSSLEQGLRQIVQSLGRDVCHQIHRCESAIRDLCGEKKKECHLLIAALKRHVVAELDDIPRGSSAITALERLRKRLQTDCGFEESNARWAVYTWAIALGVATNEDFHRARDIPDSVLGPHDASCDARAAKFAPHVMVAAVMLLFLVAVVALLSKPRDDVNKLQAIRQLAVAGDVPVAREQLHAFVAGDAQRRASAIKYFVAAANADVARSEDLLMVGVAANAEAAAQGFESAAIVFELAGSIGFTDGASCQADCAYRQAQIYRETGQLEAAIDCLHSAAGHYARAAAVYRNEGKAVLEQECRHNRQMCLQFIELLESLAQNEVAVHGSPHR